MVYQWFIAFIFVAWSINNGLNTITDVRTIALISIGTSWAATLSILAFVNPSGYRLKYYMHGTLGRKKQSRMHVTYVGLFSIMYVAGIVSFLNILYRNTGTLDLGISLVVYSIAFLASFMFLYVTQFVFDGENHPENHRFFAECFVLCNVVSSVALFFFFNSYFRFI